MKNIYTKVSPGQAGKKPKNKTNPAPIGSRNQYGNKSEKMNKLISKAMIMAMLLFFANILQLTAQTVNETATSNAQYLPKWNAVNNPGTSTINNSQIYDDGASGIGINTGSSTPLSYMQLQVPAATGVAENCLFLNVNDASYTDWFKILNSTTVDGTFAPTLWGHSESNNFKTPLFLIGSTSSTNDAGSCSMMSFDAKLNTSGTFSSVVNNQLFKWTNDNAIKMQMFANGDLGIGINTSTPAARLEVRGSDNTTGTYSFKAENFGSISSFVIRDDGSVGIGTTSPSASLDMKSLGTSGTAFNIVNSSSSQLFQVNENGKIGIGLTSPSAYLDIKSGGTSGTAFNIVNSSSTQLFQVKEAGNVGIGLTSPAAALDIKSYGSSTGTNAFNVVNNSSLQMFGIRDDGFVTVGNTSGTELDFGTYSSSSSSAQKGYHSYVLNNGGAPLVGIDQSAEGNSSSVNGMNLFALNDADGTTVTNGLLSEAKTDGSPATCIGVNSTGYLNATNGSTAYGVYGTTDGCSGTTNSTFYGIYGTNNCTSGAGNQFWAGYFNGAAGCTGGVWTVSDEKLKENIQPLNGALNNLMLLKPKTYTFRAQEYPGMNFAEGPQMGLIAQEVENIFPNITKAGHEQEKRDANGKIITPAVDFKTLNYTALIPVIISSIQEQQGVIQKQKETITAQQTQNVQLQNSVNDLQDKFNIVMAELEKVKAIQNQCCNLQQGNSNNTGSTNDQPRLDQNAPNPFSVNTTIGYYLPANVGTAAINIQSLDGKPLLHFDVAGAGNGQILVSGGSLAPGTYIYNLIVAGNQIDSKRMVIVGQ